MYLSYFSRNFFPSTVDTYTIRLWTNAIVPLPMRCGRVESKSVLARVNITPYFIDGLQWKVWLIATCGFRNRFTTVKD